MLSERFLTTSGAKSRYCARRGTDKASSSGELPGVLASPGCILPPVGAAFVEWWYDAGGDDVCASRGTKCDIKPSMAFSGRQARSDSTCPKSFISAAQYCRMRRWKYISYDSLEFSASPCAPRLQGQADMLQRLRFRKMLGF